MLLSELTLSPLILVLLGLCAGLAVLLVGQRRRYHTLLGLPKAPAPNAIVRVDHAVWNPDRHLELEERLADLTEQHTILLARHKALIREFQRMHPEPPTPPRPAPPRKVGAQA